MAVGPFGFQETLEGAAERAQRWYGKVQAGCQKILQYELPLSGGQITPEVIEAIKSAQRAFDGARQDISPPPASPGPGQPPGAVKKEFPWLELGLGLAGLLLVGGIGAAALGGIYYTTRKKGRR